MLEKLEQQKENYFILFVNAIEEEDRSKYYNLLNVVMQQLIELKYC